MKKPIRFTFLAFLTLILVSFPLRQSPGQGEGESNTQLKIEHQGNDDRSLFVEPGDRVVVQAYDGRKIKGTLNKINESSILVEKDLIEVSQIESFRAKGLGWSAGRITGLVIILLSLIPLAAGGFFGYNASLQTDGCARAINVMFAVFFGTVGFALLLGGGIPFLIGLALGRKFRMGSKWKLRVLSPNIKNQ